MAKKKTEKTEEKEVKVKKLNHTEDQKKVLDQDKKQNPIEEQQKVIDQDKKQNPPEDQNEDKEENAPDDEKTKIEILVNNMAGKYLLPYNKGEIIFLEKKQAKELIEAGDAKKVK